MINVYLVQTPGFRRMEIFNSLTKNKVGTLTWDTDMWDTTIMAVDRNNKVESVHLDTVALLDGDNTRKAVDELLAKYGWAYSTPDLMSSSEGDSQ